MNPSIIVILLLDNNEDDRVNYFRSLFSPPFFHLEVRKADFLTALRYSDHVQESLKLSNLPVLLIKSSSISNCSQDTLRNKILDALNYSFDLFYFSHWNDDCQKLVKIKDNIYRTFNPQGAQAVLFSEKGKSKILQRNKFDVRDLETLCYTPSLFSFDISFATDDKDYEKLNECGKIHANNNSSIPNYIWFIVIVFLIILLVWSIVRAYYNNK